MVSAFRIFWPFMVHLLLSTPLFSASFPLGILSNNYKTQYVKPALLYSVDCAIATSVNNRDVTDFLTIRKGNKENSYLGSTISFISQFARVWGGVR